MSANSKPRHRAVRNCRRRQGADRAPTGCKDLPVPSDEPDLLELLATDHARIQRLLASAEPDLDAVAREIEAHVVSEDQLLYREMREQMQADPLVDDLLDLDQR